MASHKTLLAPLLKEILVKEIGEANISPLKWNKVNPIKYEFPINIGNNAETVTVRFGFISDIEKQFYFPPKYKNINNIFNVGYDISGVEKQFAKTDLKTLLTILSTVIDIIKDFVEHGDGVVSDVEGLYIKGSSKDIDSEDTSQKSNLYKAFISKQLQQFPNFGFDTYRDGFILIKK
jgi:hypothetical protein